VPKKESSKKPTPKYDSERETRVLLEKIGSDVTAIAEGHSILDRKIDKIDYELNRKIDNVGSKLNEVISEVSSMQTAIMELDKKTDRIEKDLGVVKTTVEDVSKDIKGLKAGRDDSKHVTSDHEQRLTRLEAVK
jgi:chromosome segregation ATPase